MDRLTAHLLEKDRQDAEDFLRVVANLRSRFYGTWGGAPKDQPSLVGEECEIIYDALVVAERKSRRALFTTAGLCRGH